MFGIWCMVSGGYSGTRVAWLKVNGERYEASEVEAARQAELLNKQMNGPNATARFFYKALRVT